MTLADLISRQNPTSNAILSLDRNPLQFSELTRLTGQVRDILGAAGVPAGARIATALRNGPEAASAFLAFGCRGPVAPLNPGMAGPEFVYVLEDLSPSLLIADADTDTAAVDAARALGIPVARLRPSVESPAGSFSLDGLAPQGPPAASAPPTGGDELLLLHTSGTTAKPKLVPITQAAFCTSARSVAASLQLTLEDVGLNVMPLFHVHGLVACLAAPLSVGASAWCSPGFSALHFLRWLEMSQATWYSAVPSMHQTILGRMRGGKVPVSHQLRLIRSCSAPLAESTWRDLEERFGVPVVQAYGMTEAAHQVASSVPSESELSRGTVGKGTGPEIVVVDETGVPVSAGTTGEVALRGTTILKGYLSPPGANEAAFRNGLFLTGDLGRIDANGNLRLEGRRKEMINCGGEKISPYEIEEVLSALPFVEQSVAFPVPHKALGEEPGVALVCAPDHQLDLAQLRSALGQKLSARKVPRRFWVLDKFPMGPTGKLQRSRMAEILESLNVTARS